MVKKNVEAYCRSMEPIVAQYYENFEVFGVIFNEFEKVHKVIVKEIEFCFGKKGNSQTVFALVQQWFKYFVGVRTEYNLVHYGAAINDFHANAFQRFIAERKNNSSCPLVGAKFFKDYEMVSCSNCGIQNLQEVNKGEVINK